MNAVFAGGVGTLACLSDLKNHEGLIVQSRVCRASMALYMEDVYTTLGYNPLSQKCLTP